MKIRNATSKDRKKITELYFGLYPDWKRKVKGKVPLDTKVKKIVLLAEDKKDVVGFCWANLIQHGFSKFGYIEDLFVSEGSRKKGVGTMLVKRVVKEMKKKGVAAIFITTSRKNKNAIEFYKKSGFIVDKNVWLYWSRKK
ncbi:MAG: GNAT family N-acetyltransferase [Candidatus Aenigmatarchaeota archaeon]